MSLEHAILGFLSREPMTGYELKTRCFDGTAAHFWTADQAQIYRTLDRLAEAERVSSELVVQRGRPDRKVYSVTDTGRERLTSWLAQPKSLPPTRDPFMIQLFFASDLSEPDILTLLESALRDHRERLASLEEEAEGHGERLYPTPASKRESAMEQMTLDAAIEATRTTIGWLEDCATEVSAGLPISRHSRSFMRE